MKSITLYLILSCMELGLAYLLLVELIAGENGELLLSKEEHTPDAPQSKREEYSQYDDVEIERLPGMWI